MEVENAGIAAAMAAVFQLRRHGRHGRRVVLQRGFGHGSVRNAWIDQYKLIPQGAYAVPRGPRIEASAPMPVSMFPQMFALMLAAPDKGHLARHDRHELHVRRQ